MGALDLAALVLIPATVAAGVALVWLRLSDRAGRYALSVAVAAGLVAGCWIYPDQLPITPDKHWHWFPYVGALAAIIGGGAAFAPLPVLDRKLLYFALGAAAAFVLVPNWPSWPESLPARPILILRVAAYIGVISAALAFLPDRIRGRGFVWILALSAAASAALITSEVSLRYGNISLRVATALAGCWAASWLLSSEDSHGNPSWPQLTLALIPLYAVLIGGGLFVAAIEPEPPKYPLLLAPATPLLLWLFAFGPLAKLEGLTAIVAQSIAIVLIPAVLLVSSLLQTEPADEWSHSSPSYQVPSTQH